MEFKACSNSNGLSGGMLKFRDCWETILCRCVRCVAGAPTACPLVCELQDWAVCQDLLLLSEPGLGQGCSGGGGTGSRAPSQVDCTVRNGDGGSFETSGNTISR